MQLDCVFCESSWCLIQRDVLMGLSAGSRCKKISEAGSQQLLLDTQAIKGILLELPSAGVFDIMLTSSALDNPGCISYVNSTHSCFTILREVRHSRVWEVNLCSQPRKWGERGGGGREHVPSFAVQ